MIGIVDTGAGNLTSVRAALDRLGRPHQTLAEPGATVDVLLVPGQGHFGAVMERLRATGWADALCAAHATERPILGICVGLQILFEGSDEAPDAAGLGLLPGRAERLAFPKRPMVGWAPVAWEPDVWTGAALPDGDAYFVNSFAVRAAPGAELATTTYGETFVSAVRAGRTAAVQFHPEKSGAWGTAVLDRLLAT